jgi:hypothetical protein
MRRAGPLEIAESRGDAAEGMVGYWNQRDKATEKRFDSIEIT